MTNPHIAAIAQTLIAARRDRQPADPTQHVDQLQSTDDAYAVQELVRNDLAPEQAAVGRYWKSGASSRTADLLSSALLDAGVWTSPAQARDWPFNMRLIEIEIALKTNRLVTPAEAATLTHEQAHALIGAMAVTIEVVDSRWQQTEQLQPLLKLADMQTHGALVVDAIIYNRASFSQPFPLLELRFADLNGQLLASRRFKPGEYLGGELAGQAEMPPQTPIHVSLEILDPGAKAVNYSLSFHSPE